MQLLIYDIDGTTYLRRNLKTKYYFINFYRFVSLFTLVPIRDRKNLLIYRV